MAKIGLFRDSWTSITDTGILQAGGGRVLLADVATPDPDDWLRLSVGTTLVVSNPLWAKAVDENSFVVVVPV